MNTDTSTPTAPGGPEFDHDLAGARDGRPDRLGSLLERYRPYLLAIARQAAPQQIGGKVGASDLVQDTLVRGIEHFASFDGATPEQLAGWLRQILLNHARNVAIAYSADKRDVAREQLVDSRLAVISSDSPSQMVMARERDERFQQALARLPAALRTAIELRHRENLTFEEIGNRLGKSENTARRIWARAIAELQSELVQVESSTG